MELPTIIDQLLSKSVQSGKMRQAPHAAQYRASRGAALVGRPTSTQQHPLRADELNCTRWNRQGLNLEVYWIHDAHDNQAGTIFVPGDKLPTSRQGVWKKPGRERVSASNSYVRTWNERTNFEFTGKPNKASLVYYSFKGLPIQVPHTVLNSRNRYPVIHLVRTLLVQNGDEETFVCVAEIHWTHLHKLKLGLSSFSAAGALPAIVKSVGHLVGLEGLRSLVVQGRQWTPAVSSRAVIRPWRISNFGIASATTRRPPVMTLRYIIMRNSRRRIQGPE
ncbi:hypothetical protein C8R47DRAFT_1199995 [Mycena vitilis]|nr:hypothetical protein C8R47DRAFT_1199995 [Mycena vitilis]